MSHSRLFKCLKNCATYAGLGAFVGVTLPPTLKTLTPVLDPIFEFENTVMLLLQCLPADDFDDLNPFLFLSRLSIVALFGLACFTYGVSKKTLDFPKNLTASDWIILGSILGGAIGALKPIKQKTLYAAVPSANNLFLEKRLHDIQFPLDNIPERFLCPITLAIMDDPIIASDGHTYDRLPFINWLSIKMESPLEHTPLPNRIMIPNKDLRAQILEFVENAERQHKTQRLKLSSR